LIFLSPVFDEECVQSGAFARECQRSKIFVLTGALDDRVPVDYVREHAEIIARCGAKVTFETEDKADHFLLFSHRDRVLASLEKWLRSTQ
jgi:pimeloyl-ACP methyl ester carboxylesterase